VESCLLVFLFPKSLPQLQLSFEHVHLSSREILQYLSGSMLQIDPTSVLSFAMQCCSKAMKLHNCRDA
jgi:hypothetical protein